MADAGKEAFTAGADICYVCARLPLLILRLAILLQGKYNEGRMAL